MQKTTLNSKGFGLLGVLLVVLVLAAVGGVGVYVYHRNHKNHTGSPASNNHTGSTSTGNTDPYAGWKRYTSTVGSFKVSYPVGWSIEGYTGQYNTTKVPAAQLTGRENSVLLTSSTSKSNAFGIWLTVGDSQSSTSSLDSAFTQIPYNQGSIYKTLSNSLTIWEADRSLTVNGHSNPDTCTPFETASNGKFGFKLNNGKYLDASMSFCYAHGQTTAYTYDQQASSAILQQAMNILSSLKQN